MQRLSILAVLCAVIFVSVAAAAPPKQKRAYDTGYFRMPVSEHYSMRTAAEGAGMWVITPADKTVAPITLSVQLITVPDIDQLIEQRISELEAFNKNFRKKGFPFLRLEDRGSSDTDKIKLRWLQYAFFPPDIHYQEYRFLYILYGEQYQYTFSMEGDYDHMAAAQKALEEVVDAIQIQK